jgi:hypothetical protein
MIFLKWVRRSWFKLKFEFEAGFNKQFKQQPEGWCRKPACPSGKRKASHLLKRRVRTIAARFKNGQKSAGDPPLQPSLGSASAHPGRARPRSASFLVFFKKEPLPE